MQASAAGGADADQTVRDWDQELVPTGAGRTTAPDPTCPVEAALAVVSSRWATLVLRELAAGPCSFTELGGRLPTLSDKVLTERLTALHRQGVVSRTTHRGFPVRVRYELTSRGRALRPLLVALYEAGEVLLAE